MPGDYGEIKIVTATIPSGAGTSSGVNLGGYRNFSLFYPTLTSAALSFLAGYQGEVRISAAAAQASGRDFIWHMKG